MADKDLTRRDFIKKTTLAGLTISSLPLIGQFASVSGKKMNSERGMEELGILPWNRKMLCPPDEKFRIQGPYENFLARVDEKKIPFNIVLELTYRCNLRCHHCYQVRRNSQELKLAFIKKILEQLADNGCLNLSFSGGEPLLREDFFEISAYARNLGFACTLITNGTKITPEIADKIRDLSFAEVFLSLHGANAKTHDLITGVNGSYKRTVNGAKRLVEREIKTTVQTVAMKENVHEITEIEKLAKSIGAKFVYDVTIIPKVNGDLSPLEHLIDTEKARELLGYSSKDSAPVNPGLSEDSFVCVAGRTTCAITPEGDVFPCVALPLVAGNLKQKDFREIWRESSVFKRLRELKNSDFVECMNCSGKNKCFRCLSLSFLRHGDVTAPVNQICRIWKEESV